MKYKVKTENYYKEDNSLFYTCSHCGVQYRTKSKMKKIHIPNCLENPKRSRTELKRLSFTVTIKPLINNTFQTQKVYILFSHDLSTSKNDFVKIF